MRRGTENADLGRCLSMRESGLRFSGLLPKQVQTTRPCPKGGPRAALAHHDRYHCIDGHACRVPGFRRREYGALNGEIGGRGRRRRTVLPSSVDADALPLAGRVSRNFASAFSLRYFSWCSRPLRPSVSPLFYGWAVDVLAKTPAQIVLGAALSWIAAYTPSRAS